jgi:hypothetical protein
MRNTHKTIAESLVTLGNSEIVDKIHKEVVAYLSMGFETVWRSLNVEIRRLD